MPIKQLEQALTRIANEAAGQNFVLGKPHLMVQAAEKLRAKGLAMGKLESRDRLHEALALLERRGMAAACETHLRYLCWALTEPYGAAPPLLEQPEAVITALLEQVRTYMAEQALPISAWRGLLAGYLGLCPAEEPCLGNWRKLRLFLSDSLASLLASISRAKPNWLLTLDQHSTLLGPDPCDRYAADVLAGNDKVLEPLRQELGIPQDSWFWSHLVLSQVRHVIGQSDGGYLLGLAKLLPLLNQYPLLVNDALVLLLTRHYNTQPREAHQGLEDFAIAHWGSPNLFAQQKWELVEPPVKQMVREWVVRRDLRDFFEMLAEDGAAEPRRLAYWLRFASQIDYAHFALGRQAYENTHSKYVELRKRKKGQVSLLTESWASNNAFIMKLGPYFFIEFGETGNAAFGYPANGLPFNLHSSSLGTNSELKSKRNIVFRVTHGGPWEIKFDKELADLGIYPDSMNHPLPASNFILSQPGTAKPQMTAAADNRPGPLFAAAAASAPKSGPTDWVEQAQRIARYHGLKIDDFRHKKGSYWIEVGTRQHPAGKQLEALGFQFHSGRGYWKK